MSILSASLRAPVAPALLHHEASCSYANFVERASSNVSPRATLSRRNTYEHFKKLTMPMHSPCSNIDRIGRLQVSARQADHIRSVPVQVAYELINAGHHCLDVRTREEYAAGHVEGSLNIPYLVKVGLGMSKNDRFLKEVEAEFGKDDEIIVSCQSGKRSMMAAAELRAAEFTGITDMGGGFAAWKESGLPVKHSHQARSHSV